MTACNSSQSGTENMASDGNAKNGAVTPAEQLFQSQIADTQVKTVFTNNGTKYYCNGSSVWKIVDDNTFELVKVYDQEKLSNTEIPKEYKAYYDKTGEQYDPKDFLDSFYYSYSQDAACGNDFYGIERDNSGDYNHWSFKDSDMVTRERIDTKNALEPVAHKYQLETDRINDLLYYMYFPLDGGDGFIYAPLRFDNETASKYSQFQLLFVRCAKDGSKYEMFDGVSVSDFTISDGWVYYYDSGYVPEEGKYKNFDAKRRGIYKMRTDGSEKTKIVDQIPINQLEENRDYLNAVYKMAVVGDSLYYIVKNNNNESYLYTVALNGGTAEKVTKNTCGDYYIDASNNTLYYIKSDTLRTIDTLFVHHLSDHSETSLKTNYPFTGSPYGSKSHSFSVDGDYLYVADNNELFGNSIDMKGQVALTKYKQYVTVKEPEYLLYKAHHTGERINLQSGEVDYLFQYRFYDTAEDPLSGFKQVNYAEPDKTVWKSAEEIQAALQEIRKKYNLDEEE